MQFHHRHLQQIKSQKKMQMRRGLIQLSSQESLDLSRLSNIAKHDNRKHNKVEKVQLPAIIKVQRTKSPLPTFARDYNGNSAAANDYSYRLPDRQARYRSMYSLIRSLLEVQIPNADRQRSAGRQWSYLKGKNASQSSFDADLHAQMNVDIGHTFEKPKTKKSRYTRPFVSKPEHTSEIFKADKEQKLSDPAFDLVEASIVEAKKNIMIQNELSNLLSWQTLKGLPCLAEQSLRFPSTNDLDGFVSSSVQVRTRKLSKRQLHSRPLHKHNKSLASLHQNTTVNAGSVQSLSLRLSLDANKDISCFQTNNSTITVPDLPQYTSPNKLPRLADKLQLSKRKQAILHVRANRAGQQHKSQSQRRDKVSKEEVKIQISPIPEQQAIVRQIDVDLRVVPNPMQSLDSLQSVTPSELSSLCDVHEPKSPLPKPVNEFEVFQNFVSGQIELEELPLIGNRNFGDIKQSNGGILVDYEVNKYLPKPAAKRSVRISLADITFNNAKYPDASQIPSQHTPFVNQRCDSSNSFMPFKLIKKKPQRGRGSKPRAKSILIETSLNAQSLQLDPLPTSVRIKNSILPEITRKHANASGASILNSFISPVHQAKQTGNKIQRSHPKFKKERHKSITDPTQDQPKKPIPTSDIPDTNLQVYQIQLCLSDICLIK